MRHIFYTMSSFVHHSKAIGEFKLGVQSENAQFRSKLDLFCFVPCDLEIWHTNLKNNRAPLLNYFKLCASFRNHWWIETGVAVRKRQICVKIGDFFCLVRPWRMTLKKNMTPLLYYFKLCASFRSHRWIKTGVMVRKRLNCVLTSVTLTFHLWSWPLAWTSLLSRTEPFIELLGRS